PFVWRGWDSNPRGPFGPNALAGRRHKPLGHLSDSSYPQQLPLLGSNQDSPDPESGVLPITPRGNRSVGTARRGRPPVTCSRLPTHGSRHQSGRRGSNPRPSAWEADALPTELLPRHP